MKKQILQKTIEVDPNQGDNGATAAVGGSHADAGIELKWRCVK